MSDSLRPPWTVAYQASLSMGFFRKEYWNGLPFPFPGDLLNPGIEPESPELADGFFTTEPPGALYFRVCSDSKFLSIQSVMPPSHLILCCRLLLFPSIFPSIRVFSSESALCIRYCQSIGASASASILPKNIQG